MMARWMTGHMVIAASLWSASAMLAQDLQMQGPPPRPAPVAAAVSDVAAPPDARQTSPARDPTKGAVTNLPVPRYVTLKTDEGNARRGPGLSNRVDWVFTRAGLPLRITAEYENWRRVEDAEGVGGWIHFRLLSGTRSILVTEDMAALRDDPRSDATVVAQAEQGVVGRLLECNPDWCRVALDGYKGWVQKTAIWGVDPGEVVE
ncbi:MAG: SH3 domain-containing protein [Pseudomonadota bacterium]